MREVAVVKPPGNFSFEQWNESADAQSHSHYTVQRIRERNVVPTIIQPVL